ncbi:MAG: chemotaxis protein CheA [Lachnospiraceae bacterium]|nr:chemotaxis protein CheA [Lachnospiraceae bacterium]
MDVSQYLDMFLDETKEHLQNLSDQIMRLEENPEDADTINEIFRAAHTLKGMAGTMGFTRMQTLTHDMENVFSEVRSGKLKVQSQIIDVFFNCLDALDDYVQNIQNTSDEGTDDHEDLIKRLNDCLPKEGQAVMPGTPYKKEQPAQPSVPEVKQEESQETNKWDEIELDEAIWAAIDEARADGDECYGLNIVIQEKCLLKAARAFLVLRTVGEKGEIIASSPSTQDIEDEKFDRDFTLIVISNLSLEEMIKAASNISEIEKVTGGVFLRPGERSASKASKPEAEPIKEEQSSKEQPAKGQEQPVKDEAPQRSIPSAEVMEGTATTQTPSEVDAKEKKSVSTGKHLGNKTIRVDIEKLDELMNLVSELIIAKNSIVAATQSGQMAAKSIVKDNIEYLERVTTNLHEAVMKARMVPIETVTNKFPRMIRDIAKKLDKKMELYISGEDTELDRTVVDELGDPLMHLLRNCADHGLETEEVRMKRGKNPVGSIFLNASQVGNSVVIEVRDDGNGIDVDAIRRKAVERGTITQEQSETMSEKELIDLLFLPSFSTAKQVTDVSGRGVGLDVVKSKIESLSGEVEVKSKLGEGSSWTIRLPMTLAIIQTLMVGVGGEKYAIPLGSIQSIETVHFGEIKTVQNKQVINLRGVVLPLVRLYEVLEVEGNRIQEEEMTVVVVKKGDRYAGLMIDELIGQLEIVIKPLGKYSKQCKFISGATILGDGEVALILDANALI